MRTSPEPVSVSHTSTILIKRLSSMLFCDLTSDPRVVILSQTHIEYSLWLTSQRLGEEAVFYYTVHVYVEQRDRDILYLL